MGGCLLLVFIDLYHLSLHLQAGAKIVVEFKSYLLWSFSFGVRSDACDERVMEVIAVSRSEE